MLAAHITVNERGASWYRSLTMPSTRCVGALSCKKTTSPAMLQITGAIPALATLLDDTAC